MKRTESGELNTSGPYAHRNLKERYAIQPLNIGSLSTTTPLRMLSLNH